jgi:hypothetical protein
MRPWSESTFVFISTNPRHDDGGVEDRWFAVMEDLQHRGANVRFLCLMGSPAGERARAMGVNVDPYILDKWNVIRSRSRLRKYLKRYVPIAVHSTGLEADLLSRWAARKVPQTRAAVTLADDPQGTRRRNPIDRLMRRYDELGMRSLAAVFCESDVLVAEVRSAGVKPSRIVLDPPGSSAEECVARHVKVYSEFMRERGNG